MIAAVVNGGPVRVSNDSGLTWVNNINAGNRNWRSVSSSATGDLLVAGGLNTNAWYSFNFGVSWIQRGNFTADDNTLTFAVSDDGIKITAASFLDNIYTTDNVGATWKPASPVATGVQVWRSAVMASNSTLRTACSNYLQYS